MGCRDHEVVPRVNVHQVGLHVVVQLVVLDLVGHLQDPAQYLAVGYDDLSTAAVHISQRSFIINDRGLPFVTSTLKGERGVKKVDYWT